MLFLLLVITKNSFQSWTVTVKQEHSS